LKVHPTACTHRRRPQKNQPLAGAGVDLEDRDTSPDLSAFQMESGNDPVIGKTKLNRVSSWSEIIRFFSSSESSPTLLALSVP
jgi:hypothetical protein